MNLLTPVIAYNFKQATAMLFPLTNDSLLVIKCQAWLLFLTSILVANPIDEDHGDSKELLADDEGISNDDKDFDWFEPVAVILSPISSRELNRRRLFHQVKLKNDDEQQLYSDPYSPYYYSPSPMTGNLYNFWEEPTLRNFYHARSPPLYYHSKLNPFALHSCRPILTCILSFIVIVHELACH